MKPGVSWRRKGLSNRKSIIASDGPPEPVTIPSPIPWDGANTSGPGKTSMKVPHELVIYGVPAPWTTNNWPQGWSAHGALLRPASGLSKMFTFARWHPTSWRSTTIRSTMTPIRNEAPRSTQSCSMPVLCSTYPAMMPGIRTVCHQQSKTSGRRSLSLLEVVLSATWTPHTSWVMQCTRTEGPRFQTMGCGTILCMFVPPSSKE